MKYIKQQKGFTLVTVLILSSIASVLVLNSLKDNVNQERLSGNFQKSINSRLSSEQGLFEQMEDIQGYLDDNTTATLVDLIAELGTTKEGYTDLTFDGTTYTVTMEDDSGELVLTSEGNRYEGKSEVTIRLKIVEGEGTSGYSTYADAVVGCEGVSLGGSGTVDSYNSNDGDYDESSAGTEGTVKTIDETLGDVVLGGDSPILGDIIATGSIDIQSSDVTGNLHANGNVTLGDGGIVSGYVITGASYNQQSATVGGNARVADDVYMKYSGGAVIENNQSDGLDIIYGGSLTGDSSVPEEYGESPYKDETLEVDRVKNSDSTVEGYDPADPDTNCDHLDIGDIVDTININVDSTLPSFTTLRAGIKYTLTPEEGLFLSEGQDNWVYYNPAPETVSISSEFLGEDVDFIAFSSLEISGDTLTVDGNVYLFIDGNFNLSNSATININEGSSLTLVITGTFLLADQRIADETGSNVNDAQSFSLYSSYSSSSTYSDGDKPSASDPGITIQGVSDLYVSIYAPLADVNLEGSGAIYGAIRSKTVNVSGVGAMHYDEALRESSETSSGGSSSTSSTLEFIGFEY